MRRDGLFLLLLIVLAAALRLDLLISNSFVVDSDEAVVGLMANHIAAGKALPVFYYGQHYMGSLEAICVAALFWIFGSSAVALKIVPFFFSLLLILLVYELAKNAAGRNAARIAALLCAVPPSALVVWSSMARGGFIEIVVIGAFAFLLLQKWLLRTHLSLGLVAGIGLTLGLGWWVNNQILYFMLPVAFVMFARLVSRNDLHNFQKVSDLFKVTFIGLGSWLIGGAPYWIYNLRNNWASLGMFTPAESGKLPEYLTGLIQTALPIILGGARFWQADDIFPSSKIIVSSLYGLFLALYLILRHRQILSLFRLRVDRENCLEMFFLLLLSCAAIFVTSSFGWLAQAPRYLLPMYVGIFVLSAYVISYLIERSRLIGGCLLSILLLCNLASSFWGGRSIPGEPIVYNGDRVAKDHTEIINWLKSNNVQWIRTNYWIGYRLAFETNEEVKFIVNQEPAQTRIKDWPELAKHLSVEEVPLVMVPAQARIIRQALGVLNYSFDEKVVSGYHVFFNIKLPHQEVIKIDSSEIMPSSDFNTQMLSKLIDGSTETRWGSAAHQKPGMQLTLTLKSPTVIKAIDYSMGSWPQDYPRGLQIEFEKPSGERITYLDNKGWASIRYLLETESELRFYTKPVEITKVILTQTGSHPIFDWSVAEISLLK